MACKCNPSSRYICDACAAAHRNRQREDKIKELEERIEELEAAANNDSD